MKKVTFAVIGMGSRGRAYSRKQLLFPEDMEVTAVADTRRSQLLSAQSFLNLPEDRLFDSADALLAAPRLADVMIISTQDAQHADHAVRAMEKGYDLILEKPASNTLEGCLRIRDTAKRLGRRVLVCHVLRYTAFYSAIKKMMDDGVVGKPESIEMAEHVGYYHIAHSFVRGNWHREEDSSPMILAKCCHDLDLMVWLTGRHCEKLSSFGSLDYFKASNAPKGSTERCTDGCPYYGTCPYCAERFYLEVMPEWPADILDPDPTEEKIRKAVRDTDYGRCVFRMDNDVVDHQTVNFLMEDGITISFTMCGFSNEIDRTIRVMGTEGEIWGNLESQKIYSHRFHEEVKEFDCNAVNVEAEGHGGGDTGLIRDAIRYFRGDDFDSSSITTIDRSIESHLMAFAAEESRIKGGKLIDMREFLK